MAEAVRAGVATTLRDQLPSTSRYELLVRVASGGMATVYVGRLAGAAGFWRLVAIKRAHAHLLEDPMGARMLVTEARLASKIQHPNVVSVQDVEELEGELLLIMDYVEGASLSALIARADELGVAIPLPVALRIILDVAAGLHAAHALADDHGRSLGLVHRDVSPHNVLVGLDGVARLADFGIAKVAQSGSSGAGTATGALKGKVAYMAPEYVGSGEIDARCDVFGLGVIAWEATTRRRLFRGNSDMETMRLVFAAEVPAPSTVASWVSPKLDAILLKALARRPEDRFATANAFAEALESVARADALLATPAEVGSAVRELVGDVLVARRALIREKLPLDSLESRAAVEATGSIPIFVDGEPRTLTLPTSIKPEASPGHEITTLGSGSAARSMHPGSARRRPTLYYAAVALLAAGAAVTMLTLLHPQKPNEATPQAIPSASMAIETSAPSSSTAAPSPLVATAAPPSTALAAAPSATPVASTSSQIKRPLRPPHATTSPGSHQDKAPPNPYSP